MKTTLNNFLPLNRKLFKHEFWEEERSFSRFEAWLDLVASARFDTSEGRKLINGSVVRWQRGQMPISLRFLAQRWGWTKNKVDRFFILLKQEKMIETGTAEGTGQTILTICKYVDYNPVNSFSGREPGQPQDADRTAAGHAQDKTNKENNDQKSKERKIYKSFAHLCLFNDEFLKLTQAGYSKKQVDDILSEVENYKNNKKYVSLFLTAKNWLDKNAAVNRDGAGGKGRIVGIASAFQEALQYASPTQPSAGGRVF